MIKSYSHHIRFHRIKFFARSTDINWCFSNQCFFSLKFNQLLSKTNKFDNTIGADYGVTTIRIITIGISLRAHLHERSVQALRAVLKVEETKTSITTFCLFIKRFFAFI